MSPSPTFYIHRLQGLNSGPYTCSVSALPPVSSPQPCFHQYFWVLFPYREGWEPKPTSMKRGWEYSSGVECLQAWLWIPSLAQDIYMNDHPWEVLAVKKWVTYTCKNMAEPQQWKTDRKQLEFTYSMMLFQKVKYIFCICILHVLTVINTNSKSKGEHGRKLNQEGACCTAWGCKLRSPEPSEKINQPTTTGSCGAWL